MADAIKLTAGVFTSSQLGDHPPYALSGLVQITAGSITLYDGVDATGTPVLASGGVGTVGVNDNVYIRHSMFVVLAGGATGSVLTA